MRFLLLIAALLFCGYSFAESQQSIPSIGIDGQTQQKHPKQASNKTKTDEYGTDNLPFVVKIIPSNNSETITGQDPQDSKKSAPDNLSFEVISAVITAIATAVMAFFTFTLARSTKKLWETTNKSVDLAREEFIATHRPKIIVRSFQITNRDMPIGKPIGFIFIAQNIGETAAKIIEVRSGTFIQSAKTIIPTDLSFAFYEEFNVTLASGERELFPGNGGSSPEGEESMSVYAGNSALYCMGTIVYVDSIGTRRETGFCRRYHPREDIWDIAESEYEYAY
jgi:hypothetical protein